MTFVPRGGAHLVVLVALCAGGTAAAQQSNNYYWDGGSGNWDTNSSSWHRINPNHKLGPWQNAAANVAWIGDLGSAGSISVTTSITANSINFDATGYTLQTDGNPQTVNGNILLASGVAVDLHNAATTGDQVLNIGGSISGGSGITIRGATASGSASIINMSLASTSVSNAVTINLTGSGVGGIVATATGIQITGTIANSSSGATALGATVGNDLTLTSAAIISGSQGVRFAAGDSGGGGTVTLNSQSTYSGATTFNMDSGGVVKLGTNNALPTGTNVTVGAASGFGGNLDLNGVSQQVSSLASVSGAVGGIRNNASGTTSTLTVSGTTSTSFGLVIADHTSGTGKIALVKDGTSTLTLSAANAYSGGTTINGGTLVATGAGSATGSGSVSVNNGGTLAGDNPTGLLTGAITVASGGKLAPGTGRTTTGLLKVSNNVTFQSGSTFDVQIKGTTPGIGYDQIQLSAGNISLDGSLNIDLSAFTPNGAEKLTLINNTSTTGTLMGTFGNYGDAATVATYGGFAWKIYYGAAADAYGGSNGNDVVLVATPVPEPTSMLIVCTAAAAIAVFVHRRMRHRRPAGTAR